MFQNNKKPCTLGFKLSCGFYLGSSLWPVQTLSGQQTSIMVNTDIPGKQLFINNGSIPRLPCQTLISLSRHHPLPHCLAEAAITHGYTNYIRGPVKFSVSPCGLVCSVNFGVLDRCKVNPSLSGTPR